VIYYFKSDLARLKTEVTFSPKNNYNKNIRHFLTWKKEKIQPDSKSDLAQTYRVQ